MEEKMEQCTTRELVEAAIDGDLEAYGKLVQKCRDDILPELTGLMGCSQDAEDVLQDAVLRGYLKLSRLGPPYNFGGWLRHIARNMARNKLSRQRKHISLKECLTEDSPNDNAGYSAAADPMRIPALLALSRLSSKLRETARLAYLSNYSHKQVAHRLGVPLGTVKRRLWDGRRRMREEIENMSDARDNRDRIAPKIEVQELPGHDMQLRTLGPGLYFGSVLEDGHEERCSFYDYPGGILTQTVHTTVLRRIDILGRDCYEVLIKHHDCQPEEPSILDYFHPSEDGYHWIMRVVADERLPTVRFMEEGEELFPLSYSTGDRGDYVGRAVRLRVGERDWGPCLAAFWGWENGTPAESFFTEEGRQVLHRRYVGPDAPSSGSYDYGNMLQEHRRDFEGVDYRLWYDTVLSL
ncbi:MAG: sigma-70 family RNA polymerase sigma factor [Candidatus Aegiribacteria sp.]|nr:sigma-70 family RNA polymerase sigma factor [Candidatus Aegiribacteria sp.]MBD3294234.1 sigma-70 family RNA polymerase sigma factor [Candidatus Fermentibacteria bacterium]